ncbi:urease accessory protein UreD [Streptomyces sp. NPDC058548]|uniref:urease accessory protein UreD n=1 Tax=unclassified Streptomyces TaxID=2593676 RepID=UPI0036572679
MTAISIPTLQRADLPQAALGFPAHVGRLDLRFSPRAGRTELVSRRETPPLRIAEPRYVDPARPDLPVTSLLSTGGGVVQGDRYLVDLAFAPGACGLLTPRTATKLHSADSDYAAQVVRLSVGAQGCVEYLPAPLTPSVECRFYQCTRVVAHETATLLLAETVSAGRITEGRGGYAVFASDLEVRRPNGSLVATDAVRLKRDADGPGGRGLAVLGGRAVMSSLFVLAPGSSPHALASLADGVLRTGGLLYGTSVLPHEPGMWLRILGDDSQALAEALHAVWDAVRRMVLGVSALEPRSM